MEQIKIPDGYQSALNLHDTQIAIKTVKDFFQQTLSQKLNLLRVSAPVFVNPSSGLNDNLNNDVLLRGTLQHVVIRETRHVGICQPRSVENLMSKSTIHLQGLIIGQATLQPIVITISISGNSCNNLGLCPFVISP